MRIDGFQNIPDLLASSGAPARSRSPLSGREAGEVSFSDFGKVLRSVQRHQQAQEGTRSGRVQALHQALEQGSFKVDLDRLAARLVDLHVLDLGE